MGPRWFEAYLSQNWVRWKLFQIIRNGLDQDIALMERWALFHRPTNSKKVKINNPYCNLKCKRVAQNKHDFSLGCQQCDRFQPQFTIVEKTLLISFVDPPNNNHTWQNPLLSWHIRKTRKRPWNFPLHLCLMLSIILTCEQSNSLGPMSSAWFEMLYHSCRIISIIAPLYFYIWVHYISSSWTHISNNTKFCEAKYEIVRWLAIEFEWCIKKTLGKMLGNKAYQLLFQ